MTPYCINPGSQVERIGKYITITVTTKVAIIYGQIPLYRSANLQSLILAAMTNRQMPTGGVMDPSATVMVERMPNQTKLNPSAETVGAKSGMVSIMITGVSIKHPKIRYAITIAQIITIGDTFSPVTNAANFAGSCESPKKELNKLIPTNIKNSPAPITAELRIV